VHLDRLADDVPIRDRHDRFGEPIFGSFLHLVFWAVEVALHDEIVGSIVQQYFDRLRHGFARSLTRAKQNGEIADSTDIAPISELLVGSVLGLTTYARSSAPRQDIRTYISGILAMLKLL
jgi:TetR/AcrR family transcriptional regulator, transcriptional repressor for nem operon